MPSGTLSKALESPDSLAKWTFDQWRDRDSEMNFWVDRWTRTMEFLRAIHWDTLKVHSEDDLPPWRKFPVVNFVKDYYADFVAQFLESDVRFTAVPESADPRDIAVKDLAEQVLRYQWDRLDMDNIRVELASWLMATGIADLRFFWNTDTGKLLPLATPGPNGQLIPLNPDTLEPDPTLQEPIMVDAGELDVEVVSPQFVRWAKHKSQGVQVGMLLTFEEAESMYGEEIAKSLTYKKHHEGMSTDLVSLHAFTNTLNLSGDSSTKKTLVIQHYLPKSSRHPEGLWWTAGQEGRKIVNGPFPLPAGVIPIVRFKWLPVPGDSHAGDTPLYDITFSNKTYNQFTAKILEWSEKVLPKVLLKVGGGLMHGEFTDEPFQELVVNPGAEPENFEAPQPPPIFQEMLDRTLQDMQFVGGYVNQRQEGLPPGEATSRVFQPDETVGGNPHIRIALINSAASWSRAGEVILNYVANFYTEPRIIAIQGPDKSYQWQEFTGTDLANLEARIKVDKTSLYPWDKQSFRDSTIALLNTELGQILFADATGAPDMERIKAAAESIGLESSISVLDPDVLEARNEISDFRNLQQGQQPPQMQSWQNSEVHLDEKLRVVKSREFKAWSPPAQQALMANIQQHTERLNQSAEAEAQAMVEQEKSLRQVREDVEVGGDIRREMAEEIIKELLVPAIRDVLAEGGFQIGEIAGEETQESEE